jgi:hypothetical protein
MMRFHLGDRHDPIDILENARESQGSKLRLPALIRNGVPRHVIQIHESNAVFIEHRRQPRLFNNGQRIAPVSWPFSNHYLLRTPPKKRFDGTANDMRMGVDVNRAYARLNQVRLQENSLALYLKGGNAELAKTQADQSTNFRIVTGRLPDEDLGTQARTDCGFEAREPGPQERTGRNAFENLSSSQT